MKQKWAIHLERAGTIFLLIAIMSFGWHIVESIGQGRQETLINRRAVKETEELIERGRQEIRQNKELIQELSKEIKSLEKPIIHLAK